jgi:dynein heavy chain 2
MHHMELVSPSLSRSYDLKAFKGELKVLLSAAGIEGKKMCLLLEDQHLAQPAFLEVVNSLLSGGEVPGLYTNEELQVSSLFNKIFKSSSGQRLNSLLIEGGICRANVN